MEGSLGRSKWMSVDTAMTKDVICIKDTDRVSDAFLTLMEKDITGAPIVNASGDLVGVLSVTDINRSIMGRVIRASALHQVTSSTDSDRACEEKERVRELGIAMRAVAESTVASILPKDQKPLVLGPFDSLEHAVKMMAEHSVNRLPVVKDGRVVGIVTRQDIVWIVAGRPHKD